MANGPDGLVSLLLHLLVPALLLTPCLAGDVTQASDGPRSAIVGDASALEPSCTSGRGETYDSQCSSPSLIQHLKQNTRVTRSLTEVADAFGGESAAPQHSDTAAAQAKQAKHAVKAKKAENDRQAKKATHSEREAAQPQLRPHGGASVPAVGGHATPREMKAQSRATASDAVVGLDLGHGEDAKDHNELVGLLQALQAEALDGAHAVASHARRLVYVQDDERGDSVPVSAMIFGIAFMVMLLACVGYCLLQEFVAPSSSHISRLQPQHRRYAQRDAEIPSASQPTTKTNLYSPMPRDHSHAIGGRPRSSQAQATPHMLAGLPSQALTPHSRAPMLQLSSVEPVLHYLNEELVVPEKSECVLMVPRLPTHASIAGAKVRIEDQRGTPVFYATLSVEPQRKLTLSSATGNALFAYCCEADMSRVGGNPKSLSMYHHTGALYGSLHLLRRTAIGAVYAVTTQSGWRLCCTCDQHNQAATIKEGEQGRLLAIIDPANDLLGTSPTRLVTIGPDVDAGLIVLTALGVDWIIHSDTTAGDVAPGYTAEDKSAQARARDAAHGVPRLGISDL